MMHAPTPPTIPYYTLFHEELFKIRPSPLRQFLRGILISKPSGHSKHTIVSNKTKTISIDVNHSWFIRSPPETDATTLIHICVYNRSASKPIIDAQLHVSER